MIRPREDPETEPGTSRVFRQAFLFDVLNPIAALFFVSVLPRLDPAGSAATQVLVLGALDIGLGVLWPALLVLLTARLSGLMHRSGPRKARDRVIGTALAGLGVTLVGQADTHSLFTAGAGMELPAPAKRATNPVLHRGGGKPAARAR